MAEELIAGGGLVQELELLVRERQQRKSAPRFERSSHIDSRAAFADSRRRAFAPGSSRASRSKLIAIN